MIVSVDDCELGGWRPTSKSEVAAERAGSVWVWLMPMAEEEDADEPERRRVSEDGGGRDDADGARGRVDEVGGDNEAEDMMS